MRAPAQPRNIGGARIGTGVASTCYIIMEGRGRKRPIREEQSPSPYPFQLGAAREALGDGARQSVVVHAQGHEAPALADVRRQRAVEVVVVPREPASSVPPGRARERAPRARWCEA